MSKQDIELDSLPDFFTHYRHDPKSGRDVPGRFLWTPIEKNAPKFDEPLVCNPPPTELLKSPEPEPEPKTEGNTLSAAAGLTNASWQPDEGGGGTLPGVCYWWEPQCICGTRYANNCAHFLSNAFIRAGYTELTTSTLITARCPAGRPIRAQDMLRWFQSKKTQGFYNRVQPNTGIWATYQETSGWQHVVVIDTGRSPFGIFGTGDFPTWPVQWNYKL